MSGILWEYGAEQIGPKQQDSQQRERSRDKRRSKRQQNHAQIKNMADAKKLNPRQDQHQQNINRNFETVAHYLKDKNEGDQFKEVIRSLLRIEQGREEHFDKFSKIVWIYKKRIRYDHTLHSIMSQPTRYLQQRSVEQLQTMVAQAEQHERYEQQKESQYKQYWSCLIGLLKSVILKAKTGNSQFTEQYQYKVNEIIDKKLPELTKLQKQTNLILKSQSFGSNTHYWEYVLQRIKSKKMDLTLFNFYQDFKNTHQHLINNSFKEKQQEVYEEPTSPTLLPYSTVNIKLLVSQAEQIQARRKLAQRIFREEFQKGEERLQRNLSIPHNHGLLSAEIVTESAGASDQIIDQIIEFQKYKRMEQDQQQFNDWIPCETEGRFRDKKPFYLNRVRVAFQWNKYNTTHYSEQNPPPKTVQGYKFNIFYPDLYDKQKTPQYYLEPMDDPNYCLIKFKAGPPYKDIAFKILKKEWDFTQKSGFESIFSKGILQLYFNFKKPKYRI